MLFVLFFGTLSIFALGFLGLTSGEKLKRFFAVLIAIVAVSAMVFGWLSSPARALPVRPAHIKVQKPVVLIFRGLAGSIYSKGLNDLAAILRRQGYRAASYPHFGGAAALAVARRTKGPIAIVGHSAGGATALRVARALSPRTVCFLVTLDPVGSGRVPGNVRFALNFREGPFARLTGRNVHNRTVPLAHIQLDDDRSIRRQIIRALRARC